MPGHYYLPNARPPGLMPAVCPVGGGGGGGAILAGGIDSDIFIQNRILYSQEHYLTGLTPKRQKEGRGTKCSQPNVLLTKFEALK